MKNLKSNTRGFTLVELCIAMALIAIAAVLMTSFMAVFQTRSTQNSARHDFLEEVAIVKEELGEWIEANDRSRSFVLDVPQVEGEMNFLIYRGGLDPNQLQIHVIFTNGILFLNSIEKDVQLELEVIKKITLKAYEPELVGEPSDKSGSGKLLLCTLTGADAFGNEFSQNLIFALDSATFANVYTVAEPAIE